MLQTPDEPTILRATQSAFVVVSTTRLAEELERAEVGGDELVYPLEQGTIGDAPPPGGAGADEDGLKPIGGLTADIRPQRGEMPADPAAAKFARMGQVYHMPGTSRPWMLYQYWWEAPAVCHRPLYFEEVNLERYGYSHGLLQPALSGAHFFGRIPALPYLMTAEPPCDCVYTLGHYRPGSCVPYHMYHPPLSLSAAAVEAAVVTGLIFAIP